ncbi:hypothetical protein JTE90_008748 [Oedothorax gibbosus]|uniref:Uncharacterized protein n=1 Tax=Oedothorax gibbosus TaxID=931172 RepID=A0AAV6URI0_9ARAC|nr:hypothetical protein JTE90_008748 [Oedothorax gibbosus]
MSNFDSNFFHNKMPLQFRPDSFQPTTNLTYNPHKPTQSLIKPLGKLAYPTVPKLKKNLRHLGIHEADAWRWPRNPGVYDLLKAACPLDYSMKGFVAGIQMQHCLQSEAHDLF